MNRINIIEEIQNLKDTGDGENLGEGEERRMRGGFSDDVCEGGAIVGRRLLDEELDVLCLPLLDVHLYGFEQKLFASVPMINLG